MKRLVSRVFVLAATFTFGTLTFAVSAVAPAHAQPSAPAPSFGNPPSGEIPILFNDQHVYSKPDRLKKGRVLAALVRGKTILVPLRSMFEQMGATVSYNASTKTVDVSKPGSDVQVTVGKPEVTINGETRPLDVPPEIYRGSLLVPVRVISEGMGAYVLWVPDRRLVVVRYVSSIPPTPAPAPPSTPTTVPTAAPTASPAPTPRATPASEFFIVGDAMFDPKVYNEFSPGNRGAVDIAGRVGLTMNLAGFAVMGEGDIRQYRYPHRSSTPTNVACTGPGAVPTDTGCVTTLGPVNGTAFVPSFDARDTDVDGRIGIGVANPKIFLAGSYISRYGNYGYPRLNGIGGGIEKLSNFNQPIDIFGSVYYYPAVSGDFVDLNLNSQKLQYRLLHYQVGLNVMVPKTPLFLDLGYLGDRGTPKQNAPGPFSENSFFGGLGLHF